MAGKNVPVPHNGGKRLDRAKFTAYMQELELAENTIAAYLDSIVHFFGRFSVLNKDNILAWKRQMQKEENAPRTINLRLYAIARYGEFAGEPGCRVKGVKVQPKLGCENTITLDEFRRLSDKLRQGNQQHFWILQFLARTGVRVSELVRLKKECLDPQKRYQDMYSKGGKVRRIHIPTVLIRESAEFFSAQDNLGPLLFYNHSGNPYTRHGIKRLLTFHGEKCGIRREVLHPHSFRHFFAKQLIRGKEDNLPFVQEMLGHASIHTTALYLRSSAEEKRERLDASVTW